MVSGTLSWSLSSIAVAPRSCKFYTRKKAKTKANSGDNNRGRSLKHHVSEKHVTRIASLTQLYFPLISCSCLSPRKNTAGLRVMDQLLSVCICGCGCSPTSLHPHINSVLLVFFPGNLVVHFCWLWAHMGPTWVPRFDRTQR